MLERLVTPKVSSLIVAFLRSHRWSVAKIARTIGADRDFVELVDEEIQKFSESDLRKLARALRTKSHRLVIDAIDASSLPLDLRRMMDLGRPLLSTPPVFPGRKTARTKQSTASRAKAA